MSDSSDTSVEHETPKPSRKRVKCPEQWKKSVAKRKRDCGEEYVSVFNQKTVAGRSIGDDCGCPKKCFNMWNGEYTIYFINYDNINLNYVSAQVFSGLQS